MLALTLLSARAIIPRQVGGNIGDNVRREHGIIFEALRPELTGLTVPRPQKCDSSRRNATGGFNAARKIQDAK